MHGARGGEGRNSRRHMWPVSSAPGAPTTPRPAAVTVPVAPVTPSSASAVQTDPDCFVKDGRKIQVGDCALFQAGNAPPFIGIIRRFSISTEDCLNLHVNWLYRPADVKLPKGVLLEAAPNEVFYSFHKDVISADSLLHPCKVAFLREGVELPPGLCSLLCRRVYDIKKECLWWLTDQDYTKERQEEVDRLLDKTRVEMHAAVQSGGRSPKPLNAPASAPQLKPGSDSVQNSGTSFTLLGKGKKRDRGDQGTEPIKRERSTKSEDGERATFRFDNMIKAEVAKITEKGGLITHDGVERLVHLMQLDRAERKIDLSGRVLLANVIAATEKADCLVKFVQLRGVPVMDDWLQEAHKGKIGDCSSPKESDISSDELVLSLLRALDKLPVNLNALQTSHIGKSVNNLRSHKNLEIQKKARSLVDTWKKRVNLEIKTNEAKNVGSNQPVCWPGKGGLPEVNTGNRRGVSTEMSMKSSITQPSACRALTGKPGPADAIVKSTPLPPGPVKLQASIPTSMTIGSKDSLLKAAGSSGTSDLPHTTPKEEKSSSSSQSQNNSQSCSSDHVKAMGSSWKEDARSSTAGSVNASKSSGGSSRHRRPSNGFSGTGISGTQKEGNLGRSISVNRTRTLDKVSPGGLTCEKAVDNHAQDHVNGHKFIIKLPNPGRSPVRPVQSGGRGSFENTSIVESRASSPVTSDIHDSIDRKIKARDEAYWSHCSMDVNTESWQSNEVKEGIVGSDEGDKSPTTIPDEVHRSTEEVEKVTNASKAVCSPSRDEKGAFLVELKTRSRNSFSSMNALIESCANYTEANALPAGNDLGMDLLATVATGEMSVERPGRSPAKEGPSADNNESKLECDNSEASNRVQSDENTNVDSEKLVKIVGSLVANEELQVTGTDFSGSKCITPMLEKLTGEQFGQPPVSSANTNRTADSCTKSDGKLEERAGGSFSVCTPSDINGEFDHNGPFQHQDKRMTGGLVTDGGMNYKPKLKVSSEDENSSPEKNAGGNNCTPDLITPDLTHSSSGDECHHDRVPSAREPEKLEVSSSFPVVTDKLICAVSAEQTTTVVENRIEGIERSEGDASTSSGAHESRCADKKARDSDSIQVVGQLEHGDLDKNKPAATSALLSANGHHGSAIASLATTSEVEMTVEKGDALENNPSATANCESSPIPPLQETDKCTNSTASRSFEADTDGDKADSSAEDSSEVIVSAPEIASILDFDLNEGIPGDDGNQSEPAIPAGLICPSYVKLPYLSSLAASPIANCSPATITVAAPAKGPFVPPENLLKSKTEPGWKGSAATSAFRRAEPRKVVVLEKPLAADVPSSDTTGKPGRPLLNIDLNIADERGLEDVASQSSAQTMRPGVISNPDASSRSGGGLNLDLNTIDEGTENGHLLSSSACRFNLPLLPVRSASGGLLPGGEANMLRDFDLNSGPGIDIVTDSVARSNQTKNSTVLPFLHPATGLRMNCADFGSPSWFPPGNSYPAVAIPSFLSDRGDQSYPAVAPSASQRILGSVSGGGTFGGDIYRGPVLSSSPAMAFSPAAAFPYANFPYGSSFPVASSSFSGMSTTFVDSLSGGGPCFPAVPPQLVGPVGGLPTNYPRPYMLGLPEGITTFGSENSRKWVRQGLDLNAGPASAEMDTKDDRLPASSRQQISIGNTQAFIDEQAWMCQVAGGGLKRKEPEGGLDAERYVYKQQSWQ